MISNSISSIKTSVSKMIVEEDIGRRVIDTIIPNGIPLGTESEMWDYKREIIGENLEQTDKKLKYHELLKDVVSFHNGYGGYIISGIDEKKDSPLVGTNEIVDASELNDLISAYTSGSFKCFAQVHRTSGARIVLLHIPKRPAHLDPVRFIKTPSGLGSQKPYSVGDIYIRADDKCRPANKEISDWKLLLSDRVFGIAQTEKRSGAIKHHLPSPDAELVQFVGREEELSQLRSWLSSAHYPTRMITGIGGLGKTALARQFVQEVVDFKYPGIEKILWYSAKRRTFAALRGAMVDMTKYDYTDTLSLLNRMLTDFVGEGASDEDATVTELQDLLLDCLAMCPTLFVIDDIDSLSEVEQRLCVSEINNLILRTVGREHHPSRALITSRLDQGLSPTAVMKISGLHKSAFDQHVDNVSTQFRVAKLKNSLVDDYFRVSSGSPLFASSMIRLISLGEDPKTLPTKWTGSLGEDIREFAFSRELQMLSHHAASTLLAIIRLEKASISELSEALMFPVRRFNDLIGELQKFHLVSTVDNKGIVPTFSASSELVSVIAPLKEKLGQTSLNIERDCARIKKERNKTPASLAQSIHAVIGLLKNSRPQDAFDKAKLILQENKKNPDAHCLFARTALEISTPALDDANSSVEFAINNGCTRPELDSLYVDVKYGIEDWKSLVEYFRKKPNHIAYPKNNLIIYVEAMAETAKIMISANRRKDASELTFNAIRIAYGKINSFQEVEVSRLNAHFAVLTDTFIQAKGASGGDQGSMLNSAFAYNDLSHTGYRRYLHTQLAVAALSKYVSSVNPSRINVKQSEQTRLIFTRITDTVVQGKRYAVGNEDYSRLVSELDAIADRLKSWRQYSP